MSNKARIRSDFKRTKTAFLLATFEPFFYMPTTKCDLKQTLQGCANRGITYKILGLTILWILRHNQPIGPFSRHGAMLLIVFMSHQMNLGSFYLPDSLAASRVLDGYSLPFLAIEDRAISNQIVHTP